LLWARQQCGQLGDIDRDPAAFLFNVGDDVVRALFASERVSFDAPVTTATLVAQRRYL
jgi:hypothetical protein